MAQIQISLSWDPPTTRADGTDLDAIEIASYWLDWSSSDGAASGRVVVPGDLISTQFFIDLEPVDVNPGLVTLNISVIAVDADGRESTPSEVKSGPFLLRPPEPVVAPPSSVSNITGSIICSDECVLINGEDEIVAEISIPGYSTVLAIQGTSDAFPAYVEAPSLTSYVSGGTFNNTYYCDPAGDDTTGDGSIGDPWFSVKGANDGGTGTPIAAGDLLYFRGGTYTFTESGSQSSEGYYQLNINGTVSDYIVITAYPGETPIFQNSLPVHASYAAISMHIKGNYVVVDGITFDSALLYFGRHYGPLGTADYCVVQNCSFLGYGHDASDQANGATLVMVENCDYITIINNFFDQTLNGRETTTSHCIKNFNGTNGIVTGYTIKYNRFVNCAEKYGLYAIKGPISELEIANNRFENITGIPFSMGPMYGTASFNVSIHHNAFDTCESVRTGDQYIRGAVFTRNETSVFEDMQNLHFNDNIIINSGTELTMYLLEDSISESGGKLGEIYNNAIYIDREVIYNENGAAEYANYPSYLNYNAYPSTTIRDTAVNQNSEPVSSWQDHAHIQSAHGITRTGVEGNRFYTIENDNGFVGAGRYGDNIGGFEF